MSTPRIAVFGAGAIGCVVAWRLTRAGAQVSLIGRGTAIAAVAAQGLRFGVGQLDECLPVRVVDLSAGLGRELPFDVLLMAVKAHDLPGALAAAAPLISPSTTIVPLVNGLPWWLFHGVSGPHAGPIEAVDPGGRLWQSLPAGQVLGAVVHLGAEVVAPGWVRQAGDGRLTLGELDGQRSERALALAALLEAGGLPTQVHPSIRDEVWSKLVGNGSSNPLSVVSGATLDRLFAEPGLRALVEAVMLEIMALGAGLGVRFPLDVQARIAVGQRLGAFRTSMLQDFDLGRPLELGAIADAPLELAERLRVPMPTTRLVRDLARAAERSRDLKRHAVNAPNTRPTV